jgi:hypothetical protein
MLLTLRLPRSYGRSVALAASLFLGGVAACSGDDSVPPGAASDAGADGSREDGGPPQSPEGGPRDASVDSTTDAADGESPDAPAPDASPDGAGDGGAPDADSGGDSSDGDAALDGSSPDGDATVEGDSSDVDGSSNGDAAGDGSAPDGGDGGDADTIATGPVTMHVTLGGAPEPGVLVVFQDAQGSVLASGTTDASGAFASVVPEGSQVTVILRDGLRTYLETVTALTPGDSLTAIDPGAAPTSTVSVDSLPPAPAGATEIDLFASVCGIRLLDPASPGAPSLGFSDRYATCASGGRTSLLGIAYGDAGAGEVAYTYLDGIDLSSGGQDGGIPVAITQPWSAAQRVTVTAPDTSPLSGDIVYEESSSGVIWASGGLFGQGWPDDDVDAGQYEVPANAHVGYPDSVQIEGALLQNPPSSAELAIQASAMRVPPPTGGERFAVDFSNPLPEITSASITLGDAGAGASQGTIAWTPAAPLTGADAVVAWVTDFGLQDGEQTTWMIVGPSTATSFAIPALPAGTTALDWSELNTNLSPIVYALDVSSFAGYGDFKRAYSTMRPVLGTISQPTFGVIPLLPAGATARLTAHRKG